MTQQNKVTGHQRRSLELTTEQWAVIEAQAERFNATAQRGTNTGQPTWRRLMQMIADGEIILTESL